MDVLEKAKQLLASRTSTQHHENPGSESKGENSGLEEKHSKVRFEGDDVTDLEQSQRRITVTDLAEPGSPDRGIGPNSHTCEQLVDLDGDAEIVLQRSVQSQSAREYEKVCDEMIGQGLDPALLQCAKRAVADPEHQSRISGAGEPSIDEQCDQLAHLAIMREVLIRSTLQGYSAKLQDSMVAQSWAERERHRLNEQLQMERITNARKVAEVESEVRDITMQQQMREISLKESLDSMVQSQAIALDAALNLSELDKVAIVNSVIDTMEHLKGRVIHCTSKGLVELTKIAYEIQLAKDSFKVFKEAHMQLKSILVQHFGNRKCGCGKRFKYAPMPQQWPLREEDFDILADFEQSNILLALKRLVVSFDNIAPGNTRDAEPQLRTYVEISWNANWLFSMAEKVTSGGANHPLRKATTQNSIMELSDRKKLTNNMSPRIPRRDPPPRPESNSHSTWESPKPRQKPLPVAHPNYDEIALRQAILAIESPESTSNFGFGLRSPGAPQDERHKINVSKRTKPGLSMASPPETYLEKSKLKARVLA